MKGREMAWVFANTGEDYEGETHELAGHTYSGATRTPESRRLIEVPARPTRAPSKPSTAKKKAAK